MSYGFVSGLPHRGSHEEQTDVFCLGAINVDLISYWVIKTPIKIG
jgi:hypothetical protein